jgi:hypothetical protein
MRGIKVPQAPPRSARPPPGRALLQRHYPAQSLQYLAAIKRAPERLQRPPAVGHRAAHLGNVNVPSRPYRHAPQKKTARPVSGPRGGVS